MKIQKVLQCKTCKTLTYEDFIHIVIIHMMNARSTDHDEEIIDVHINKREGSKYIIILSTYDCDYNCLNLW